MIRGRGARSGRLTQQDLFLFREKRQIFLGVGYEIQPCIIVLADRRSGRSEQLIGRQLVVLDSCRAQGHVDVRVQRRTPLITDDGRGRARGLRDAGSRAARVKTM